MNRLLLCPPDFYGVRYSINPWMDPARGVDHERAVRQWSDLRELLTSLGCQVEVMRPQPEWPDMVFTANAALIHRQKCILSRFRHAERDGETRWYRQWLGRDGFEMTGLSEEVCFEGEGDAIFYGDRLICGHGFRTDAAAPAELAEMLGCETVALRLVDPHFYHLDTCFCPVNGELALWHPEAFDAASQTRVEQLIADRIKVSVEEARRFACNSIVLGSDVVLPMGCPDVCHALGERGYRAHELEMGEFIKAGGACKCLVLNLGQRRAVD